MEIATPVRRHRGGALQDRPLGWARNPLTEFDQLLSEMSGLIESTVGGAAPAVAWTLLADVTESDGAFHVEIELPGVKSKDSNVEANGQEVVVTGEIKEKEHHRPKAEVAKPRHVEIGETSQSTEPSG
ncbi:Hsp20 family protein [Streptomyces phaeochromogenes]|uniref:Hsp20 family protein n=1 Tax=Streptomyces phaeochromogenes TaxID=1923 RepID=A0ABZ1HS01_STRPH|nr:Hsp20 family protein [Streptomyces phaeochromogenes]WSD21020.1 Hsp20 family protein [Streptomyces phaeochromogenes]